MRGTTGRALVLTVVALVAAACSGNGETTAPPAVPAGTATGTAPGTTAPAATRLPTPARYAGYRSDVYADKAHWVCRPDTDDVCDHGLDATVVKADGTLTPEPFTPAADPSIDCFYVYPTISRDPTANSDLTASPTEEGVGALGQVARLGTHCRVFAPTYRQITLTSLTGAMSGKPVAGANPGQAYADVVDAWKSYMANDNEGRGVVLVGHSQGSSLITQLIKSEIDPNADVRRLLVSAFIAGSAVRVPAGADVGGDFANTPLCRKAEQVGCVYSWASFRADPGPPANTRFGKPRGGDGVAACNTPAAPAGGKAVLRSYFSRTPNGAVAALNGGEDATGKTWIDPAKGAVTTNFVSVPGLVNGECTVRDGVSYLAVTVNADPTDPRADDIGGDIGADWGLHLQDVALVMGDMVDVVGREAAAFPKASASG
jgi:hypothetical protein